MYYVKWEKLDVKVVYGMILFIGCLGKDIIMVMGKDLWLFWVMVGEGLRIRR